MQNNKINEKLQKITSEKILDFMEKIYDADDNASFEQMWHDFLDINEINDQDTNPENPNPIISILNNELNSFFNKRKQMKEDIDNNVASIFKPIEDIKN